MIDTYYIIKNEDDEIGTMYFGGYDLWINDISKAKRFINKTHAESFNAAKKVNGEVVKVKVTYEVLENE
jgi:hypothetical protein